MRGEGGRTRWELSLTAELVALVDRIEPETGQEPGLTPLQDDDYARLASDLCGRLGDRPLRVFAYGSLIWKPELDAVRSEKVRVHGWRRSFCLNLTAWRGTPEIPGLMLALDRGGCCDGVLLEFSRSMREPQMERLLRRELDYTDDSRSMRWLRVRRGKQLEEALTFYAGPCGEGYVNLPLAEQARRIAAAAGRAGSCASYLHNTITKLAEHGIHDGYLWRLQELVAAELRRSVAAKRLSARAASS